MKPTKQDRLTNKAAGEHGNCLSACLASLLEIDLADVPHFFDFIDDTDDGVGFHKAVNAWLSNYNLSLLFISPPQVSVESMFKTWGIENIHHVIAGPSPRSGDHAVVGFEGQPVFDPHPENTYLKVIEDYGLLIVLNPAKPAGKFAISNAQTKVSEKESEPKFKDTDGEQDTRVSKVKDLLAKIKNSLNQNMYDLEGAWMPKDSAKVAKLYELKTSVLGIELSLDTMYGQKGYRETTTIFWDNLVLGFKTLLAECPAYVDLLPITLSALEALVILNGGQEKDC